MARKPAFDLTFKRASAWFFDRVAVARAVDVVSRKALSRIGAYIRRTARQSIRKRKGSSPAGKPPSSHTGLLRQFLFFSFDPDSRSVVIGPTRLNGRTANGTIPATLEYGGQLNIKTPRIVYDRLPPTRDARGRYVKGRLVSRVVAGSRRIAPRPYMMPALEANEAKIPAIWQWAARS